MATVTLLEKARQGRRNALASLANRSANTDNNVVSLFDFAFEDKPRSARATTNVIAFRSRRTVAAEEATPIRRAA